MAEIIDLPRYPLTEMYEPFDENFLDLGYVDQGFLFCNPCTHGKLETVVPPEMLYGPGYRTKTAGSSGARLAVERFARFVAETDLSGVSTVIDIGGNDSTMVDLFQMRRIVVDPNASGEAELIKSFIEDADLGDVKRLRKLVLSSHTLEHIERPAAFFEKLASVMCHDDWLAIQVPSLEHLLRDARIDHIHHQHIHYFSLSSLGKLLRKFGFEVYRHAYDPLHYGALMVMCRKGTSFPESAQILASDIWDAYERFKARLSVVEVPEKAIGFGAALMLPVLAYHLPELKRISYIADNDKSKHGLRYVNFNKRISCNYDLSGRDVVVTGIATKMAARALVAEAFQKGARNVIVPLAAL